MKKRIISKKKKVKTMDAILVIMGIALLIFTVTMTICIYKTGGSYDVLIEKVFQACLGEGGVMGVIQTAKILKGDKTPQEENDGC